MTEPSPHRSTYRRSKTAICERIATAVVYALASFSLASVMSGCATNNVVPGVDLGASALPDGTVSAQVTVDPSAFACFLIRAVQVEALLGVQICTPQNVTDPEPGGVQVFPVTAFNAHADPEALRGSVLAGYWPVVPTLSTPVAPSRHYDDWRGSFGYEQRFRWYA